MKTITDRQMFHAAVRQLKNHLETPVLTKTGCQNAIEELKIQIADAEKEALCCLSFDYDGDGICDAQGALEARAQADRLRIRLAAYEAISKSPLHAYHRTTAALSARVAFYAEKAGMRN